MKAKPMKQIEDKSWIPCEPEEATHVQIHVPGCFPYRMLPVLKSGKREGTPNWTWNGDVDKPTLKPSILSKAEYGETKELRICHSFVTDGKIKFLNDCTHEFAGQTMDLLEVDV